MAHLIYEDPEYPKTACGIRWWAPDGVWKYPQELLKNAHRCGRCARTKRAKETL